MSLLPSCAVRPVFAGKLSTRQLRGRGTSLSVANRPSAPPVAVHTRSSPSSGLGSRPGYGWHWENPRPSGTSSRSALA